MSRRSTLRANAETPEGTTGHDKSVMHNVRAAEIEKLKLPPSADRTARETRFYKSYGTTHGQTKKSASIDLKKKVLCIYVYNHHMT